MIDEARKISKADMKMSALYVCSMLGGHDIDKELDKPAGVAGIDYPVDEAQADLLAGWG